MRLVFEVRLVSENEAPKGDLADPTIQDNANQVIHRFIA